MQTKISKEVAGQLWTAGKNSTQKFITNYVHVDFLRPYFDIEPQDFRNRLVRSFIPSAQLGAPQDVSSELYGPLMLTLTLVAVLLYGMKSTGHHMEEGTLIGTAMVVCFSYWLGISALLFFIAFVFNAHFTLLQILSITGYSLSGHCIVLLMSTLFDHYGTPGVFYVMWVGLGGLSATKLAGIYLSRTWSSREGILLAVLSVACHMLSILYLRFAYHKFYEVTIQPYKRKAAEIVALGKECSL
eukprot:Em0010g526a